jgi:hypothetical protein
LAAALILAFGAGAAHADLLYGVNSNGQAGVGALFPPQTWTTPPGGEAVTSYISPILGIGTSFASGSGGQDMSVERAGAQFSVADGRLHAQAYGFGEVTGPAITVGVSGSATGSGQFSGTWADTLFVISLKYPTGTPVDILVGNGMDSDVDVDSLAPDNSAEVMSTLSLASLLGGGSGSSALLNTASDEGDIQTGYFVVHSFVGDELRLTHQLNGEASATVIGLGSDNSVVDALNTSESSISILTPDVSYTTASGVSYDQPLSTVPEPSSVWLLGAALGAIWLFARGGSKARFSRRG